MHQDPYASWDRLITDSYLQAIIIRFFLAEGIHSLEINYQNEWGQVLLLRLVSNYYGPRI